MSLREKIENFEFWPEVYVYPTNRAYTSLSDFSLEKVSFSEELNIYIHIPFCKQICAYCGYLKIADTNENLKEEYINAIINEIRLYKDILKTKTIKTLHFGGGTPSLLTVTQLEKIIATLVEINPGLFTTAQEISLESTPETVEYDTFSALKKLGFNRISIGLQSLNDGEIILCNRKNVSDISFAAIDTLKNIGFKNIVVDLMIGIEGQTVESFTSSLQKLIAYRPDTVELYALGLMPNTKLKTLSKVLMSTKDIYTCYEIGRKEFLEAGYLQDCHNRYALPKRGGFLQEDYTFQDMSLIGFGAGARTYGTTMHYRNNYDIHSHKKSILDYIHNLQTGLLAVKTGITITPEEKMRQYIIYNIENLDTSVFEKQFGIQFKERFNEIYTELLTLQLIQEDKGNIRLTNRGLTFRDLIAKEFFSKEIFTMEETYRQGV